MVRYGFRSLKTRRCGANRKVSDEIFCKEVSLSLNPVCRRVSSPYTCKKKTFCLTKVPVNEDHFKLRTGIVRDLSLLVFSVKSVGGISGCSGTRGSSLCFLRKVDLS